MVLADVNVADVHRALGKRHRALERVTRVVQDDVLVKAWLGDNGYDQQIMQLFDTDGDGTINFDEFLVGVRVTLA